MPRRHLLGAYQAHLLRQHEKDAAAIDFADDFIYKELEQHVEERAVPLIPLLRNEALETFRAWELKQDKVEY